MRFRWSHSQVDCERTYPSLAAWEAPIRIFIFDDRVEIHSPGTLPRGFMVDDIERGTSIPRNRLLFNNAICLLPYSGIGTGIPRAIGEDTDIRFYNRMATEFDKCP